VVKKTSFLYYKTLLVLICYACYYAEQGLDVNLIERSHEINVVDQVISGVAQYGIEDSGLNASKLSVTY
jgi:hypothetical protein